MTFTDEPAELDYGDMLIQLYPVGTDVNGYVYAIRHTSEGWRFSHVCTSPRSGHTWRIAPLLQIGHGHEVLSTHPLHIEASILCDDCGTHGWVRDGEWVPA